VGRNALGSTNSDNANQLGDKIAVGVKNQLKNKAINATEGLINAKANQFVNQFGSGRSEISIHGFNSKELDYSIKTIQPLSELNDNSKDLTFFQAQLASGENHGNRRETINLGIGHRILVENDMAIAGINLFHDYETKSRACPTQGSVLTILGNPTNTRKRQRTGVINWCEIYP
jgi:ABC-type proline/glycine betaine transport system ATPase subunit